MKITIVAHPNSKNPRIEKDLFGALHVYVNQPALDGRANRAIVDALADYLGIRKSQIVLASGEHSKTKVFVISE